MPSKIVEVHRKPNFIQDSNTEPEVQEYFGMAFKAIGSYWKEIGTVYATGLTRMEEDLLMPELLGGVNPSDKFEFRKRVQEFFMNMNTKVPPEGLKLEIGLEYPEEDVKMISKTTGPTGDVYTLTNPPLRVMDYIRYKHVIGHPQVGATKDEAERYQHKQFYILDKVAAVAGKSKLRDKEDAAQRDYLSINRDLNKAEMVLTLLGVTTKGMSNDTLLLQLKAQASIDPDASDATNIERLDRFVQVVNDKELASKYDIMEMVKFGILERIRTKVLIKESGVLLGENLREAVDWFLDKSNSREVNSLYASLDAFGKDRKIKHVSPHLQDPKIKVEAPAVTASTATADTSKI